jgi:hypothetical protein
VEDPAKESQGLYLLGDPATVGPPRLWDLDVVPTTNITAGTFLVGSGKPEATIIRDRLEMQVEVSTSHEDYFARNLVAVRAEKRVALVTRRPASFIYGRLTRARHKFRGRPWPSRGRERGDCCVSQAGTAEPSLTRPRSDTVPGILPIAVRIIPRGPQAGCISDSLYRRIA